MSHTQPLIFPSSFLRHQNTRCKTVYYFRRLRPEWYNEALRGIRQSGEVGAGLSVLIPKATYIRQVDPPPVRTVDLPLVHEQFWFDAIESISCQLACVQASKRSMTFEQFRRLGRSEPQLLGCGIPRHFLLRQTYNDCQGG